MSPVFGPNEAEGGSAFTALIVEDEGLIAAGLEGLLADIGASAVTWVPRANEALHLIRTGEAAFSIAVVDWVLGAVTAEALVRALVAAGTPVLIYTGAPETVVRPPGGQVIVVAKPAREILLATAVWHLLDAPDVARGISEGT